LVKVEFIKNFGERKIDLIIVNKQKAQNDPFVIKILNEGIKL